MNITELRALIESDSQALSLAQSGAADVCAARCREIAPKETIETRVTELTILSRYSDPADAEAVLRTIETVAQSNPVVARVLKWLQPGAPGIDIGDARVRGLLVASVNAGGVGLSAELSRPLLAAAEVEPQITGADISTAYPFGA